MSRWPIQSTESFILSQKSTMSSWVSGYLGIDLILNLIEERALAIRHIEIMPYHSHAGNHHTEVQQLLSIRSIVSLNNSALIGGSGGEGTLPRRTLQAFTVLVDKNMSFLEGCTF